MLKVFIVIKIPFAIFLLAFVSNSVNAQSLISVPLRFHIVKDLTMKSNGADMKSWVSSEDLKNTVLPEVNNIWLPAGIEFELENIFHSKTLNLDNKNYLITQIVKSQRDDKGRSDPKRISHLNKLINWANHNKNVINIYLVPYLGKTSQGNANRKYKRIFVGQWTDKPSKGKKPPQRFQLVESSPYKIGSLSRTISHEIGHILGLKHPNKTQQKLFNLLMGGKNPGYKLTKKEIIKARKKAAKIEQNYNY